MKKYPAVVATTVAMLAGSLSLLTGLSGTAVAATAAPTGLAPDDSAQHKNLELSWTRVSGAISYDVQVSDDSDFNADVLVDETTGTHFAVPTTLPRGGYVWRVRAQTADGAGQWSADASFVRGWANTSANTPGNPHLVTSSRSWTSGAAVTTDRNQLPAFTWEPIVGASFYELEVSNRPFNNDSLSTGTQDAYRFTCFTQRTWFTPYGVVSGGGDAPGDEDNCRVVMTSDAAPADGSIGDTYSSGETYYWRVRGRDGTRDDRPTPFGDPALSCTGVWNTSGGSTTDTGGTIVIPSTPPTYLAKPECSPWADGGSFSPGFGTSADSVSAAPGGLQAQPTESTDPGTTTAPVLLTGTPVLRWSPVTNALKYRIYLSRTTDFTDSDSVYETQGTSMSPVDSIKDRSVPTYWVVQACGIVGCGRASAVHSFTKRGWSGVEAISDGTYSGETTLNWSTQWTTVHPGSSPVPKDDQAMTYQVQVDDVTGDFSTPVVDTMVDHLGDVASRAHLRLDHSTLPDDFVWRVRAIDQVGRAKPWAVSAPYGRLTTASGFGLGAPVRIEFTSPVDGVSTSTVKIVSSATSDAVPGTLDELTPTSWAFAPSGTWVAGESYSLSVSSEVKDSATGLSAKRVPGSIRASTTLDSASNALAKVGTGSWRTRSASDAKEASYVYATAPRPDGGRPYVQGTMRGTQVSLYACKSPSSGVATLVVDGTTRATIDLYRSYSGCGWVAIARDLLDTVHDVRVTWTGTARSTSTGRTVGVDALTVL